MTDQLDALTSDGQAWRNRLGSPPSLHTMLDKHAVTDSETSSGSSRRRPALLLAVACSVAAVIAIAITLSAISQPSRKGAALTLGTQPAASFVGFRWRVIDIAHADTDTNIPRRLDAFFGFSTDGSYTAGGTGYGYGGRYEITSNGFRTYHVSVPFSLYGGSNPAVRTLIAATQTVSFNQHRVAAQATGERLTLAVGGYRITCLRLGTQRNPPEQLPSSTTTPGRA